MKNIISIWVVFLVAGTLTLSGQDIHFSQIDASPLMNNPALTGVFKGNHRAILNYREQWSSVAYPYKTFALQYDATLFKQKLHNKDKIGLGLVAYSDKAGEGNMGITQINALASYYKMLNQKNAISVGFQGGFAQYAYNPENLTWDNQYQAGTGFDPNRSSREPLASDTRFAFFDGAAGISWDYRADKYFGSNVGVSINHIQSTNLKYYNIDDQSLYRKITVHGLAEKRLKNSETSFIPSFLYRRQGSSQELIYGCMIKHQLDEKKFQGNILETAFQMGAFHRYGDAFIFAARFSYMHFSVGVSYDVNVSKLSEASKYKGGLEFSLIYITPYERRGKGNSLL